MNVWLAHMSGEEHSLRMDNNLMSLMNSERLHQPLYCNRLFYAIRETRRQKKITKTQQNHIRLAFRRNPMNTFTEHQMASINAIMYICLGTFVKCVKKMRFRPFKITKVPKEPPNQMKRGSNGAKTRLHGQLNNGRQ